MKRLRKTPKSTHTISADITTPMTPLKCSDISINFWPRSPVTASTAAIVTPFLIFLSFISVITFTAPFFGECYLFCLTYQLLKRYIQLDNTTRPIPLHKQTVETAPAPKTLVMPVMNSNAASILSTIIILFAFMMHSFLTGTRPTTVSLMLFTVISVMTVIEALTVCIQYTQFTQFCQYSSLIIV